MPWSVVPDSEMMRREKAKAKALTAARLYAPFIVFGCGGVLLAGMLWLLMPLNDCPWGDPHPCGPKWTLGEILVVAVPAALGLILLALAWLHRHRHHRSARRDE